MRTWIIALCVAGQSAAGQSVGNAIADSAGVARAAYRRAVSAADLGTAYREIDHASRAWPTQPAYVWARAMLAARAHDTLATLRALDEYASLSLGRDLLAAKDLSFLNGSPAFRDLARRHDQNRAPLAASRVVHELADSAFWPEGVDFDARSRSYYLAGIRKGSIMRIDASGRSSIIWSEPGRASVLGVRVDASRGFLWATTSGIPQHEAFLRGDSAHASLLQLRLADGKLIRRWDLPVSPGGHVLGDLAVGSNGDVFFTDSRHPVLYRLRAGADSLETTRHSLFYSLQGIAPASDAATLYIADYSHGLLRADLETGEITRLPDAPHSTSLGCDGLTWHDKSLICVQNGVAPARIVRFVLSDDGRSIRRADVIDRNIAIADEPTIGTMADGEFVYVANSQWEKHDAAGKPLPDTPLRGPVLLGVRIR